MAHGENYTVEEQVTGKAEHGGFQFDIFPRRDSKLPVGDQFYLYNMAYTNPEDMARNGRFLYSYMTPHELNLPASIFRTCKPVRFYF